MICGVFTTTKKDLGNENKQLITRILFFLFFRWGGGNLPFFTGDLYFVYQKKSWKSQKNYKSDVKFHLNFYWAGPPK